MREGARFTQESIACGRALERLRVEKLQGDVPVQRHIVRAIHDAHATGPDGFDDFVAAECLADHCNLFRVAIGDPLSS